MISNSTSLDPTQISVPLPRLATFIRQVTHDVRNSLNAMDLQASFVAELVTDAEAVEEVRRIRQGIQQSARDLQALSGKFWTSKPNPIPYEARILVEDFCDRMAKRESDFATGVQWTVTLGDENIEIDIEMIFAAFAEIFFNAFQNREGSDPIQASASLEGGKFLLRVSETKVGVPSDPTFWGKEPFVSTRRGAYGLGLFRARGIIAAHGGEYTVAHDPERALLVTRVMLPLANSE